MSTAFHQYYHAIPNLLNINEVGDDEDIIRVPSYLDCFSASSEADVYFQKDVYVFMFL